MSLLSVCFKVAEIDEERKRLLVAIKPSTNEIQKSDELTSKLSSENLLRSLLDEREDIFIKLSGLQGKIFSCTLEISRQSFGGQ